MFTSIQSFQEEWKHEREHTQAILNGLTDQSLSQAVTASNRTLGRIAWHLVTSLHEMLSRTGLDFEAPHHDAPLPKTAAEIGESYRQASQALAQAVQQEWRDSSLNESHDMYGEQWTNAVTLNVLIKHQTHHRGQMTVLMRQAGLRVPGIYGPSLEDWSAIGMEPPEI